MKSFSRKTITCPVFVLAATILLSACTLRNDLSVKESHPTKNIALSMEESSRKENGKKENSTKISMPQKKKITICAVGDILMHMKMIEAARKSRESYDFSTMFSDIKPYIEKADLAFGNLEVVVVEPEQGYSGYPMFKCPEDLIAALKLTGFDVLTTANNHCLDGGVEGLKNTIEELKKQGLYHTGTARSYEEREQILIIEKNGIKIAVLACTYGCNGNENKLDRHQREYMVSITDLGRLGEDIKRARQEGADAVICAIHWGKEGAEKPGSGQRNTARELAALGADIILGSHPHVVQEIELIEGEDGKWTLVAYSLGNFISNQRTGDRDSGVILNLDIVKGSDGISIENISCVPTWVYREIRNTGRTYRVLPAEKFMNDKTLDKGVRKRLKEVWEKTTRLMGTH